MRILFLTENFPPETNAAATRVYERAVHWVKAGHGVTIITCAPNFPGGKLYEGYRNRWYQTEDMDGIRVVRVKTYIAANQGVARRVLDFLSFMVTGFFAALRQPRPDLVTATSPQFFAAIAGWAVGAVRRLPFVFELGDLWPISITAVGAMKKGRAIGMMEKLELFLYRRSAAVVSLTNSFRENLISRGIDGGKIDVVINGVDISRYGPRARDEALAREWGLEGKFVIGYVGTHGMAHALGNVLNAAERLRDEPSLCFLLVGAGAERESLVAEAQARNLDNVIFQPAQPKSRMPAIWSLCDVALVHLKNSPVFAGVIPSKIFEAMAMGRPILLAAPPGEATEIVEARHAGLCIPAEDPEALARAARTLYADQDLTKRYADAAFSAAPAYSREEQAEQMIAAYKKALASTA
ncbi:MAG: glycosyltransferase family 4 protein [Proteobacteria bacterium]|nr:glycosyltransferase family 4 protein [Pseudomonadota bacterium]